MKNSNGLKLHVLLAKTDHMATQFRKSVTGYIDFFKNKQGSFKGEKKTYEAKAGTIDLTEMRGNKLVVTTVDEKLTWLKETNAEYIDALFAQEATNASGLSKSELKVGDITFGTFSSLELLRLKSLLENGDLENMYSLIPVREDDAEWKKTTEESYVGRNIYESKKYEGIKKSIQKENYILLDPNIASLKDSSAYKAQVGTKDTIIELGDYSFQKFSGEWSHRERAELLRRRSTLLNAVIEALKKANDVEIKESEMTADKLFNYLHLGKI